MNNFMCKSALSQQTGVDPIQTYYKVIPNPSLEALHSSIHSSDQEKAMMKCLVRAHSSQLVMTL